MADAVILISGNDPAAIELEARRAVAHWAGTDPDPAALEVFREREDLKGADLIHAALATLQVPPFLAAQKTVWLHLDAGLGAEAGAKSAKSGEGAALRSLAEWIGRGVPVGIALVLSGPGADPDRPLGTAVRARGGRLVECRCPEPGDRNWERDMTHLLLRRAQEKGLTLDDEAAAYLVQALGTDTGRVEPELEKLCCYLGGAATVALMDVQAICRGDGEASTWAFLDAAGERRLDAVLSLLRVILAGEKDPDGAVLGLLSGLAGHVRYLLQIKVFLQENPGIRSPEQFSALAKGMAAEQRAAYVQRGFDVLGLHPFRLLKLAAQARRFTGPELVQAVPRLRDAWFRCVSGGAGSKTIVLESLVVQLVGRAAA